MAQGLLKSNKDRDGIAAVLLENIGDLEAQMQETQEAATAAETSSSGATAAVDEMQGTLVELEDLIESTGLSRISRLNRPNLLKQNYWTNRDLPTSAVVYQKWSIPAEDATAVASPLTFTVTDENITASFGLFQCIIGISDWTLFSSNLVSVSCTAGSATITVAASRTVDGTEYTRQAHGACTLEVWLCTWESRKAVYGDAARIAGSSYMWMDSIYNGKYPGDDSDGIAVSVIDLAAADQITEPDGEVYTTAIQYDITQNTTYGNLEELWSHYVSYYGYGQGAGTYKQGANPPREYGNIVEMIPGKTYTISCLARMISGKAWVMLGNSYEFRNPYTWRLPENEGTRNSGYIEITETEWRRISFTFKFNPTGPQFTDTSATVTDPDTGTDYVQITREANWCKNVIFGVSRKYTGVLQLCGFRLVEGGLYLPTKYDAVMELLEELKERVGDLEETIAENGGA